jgi:hypothetical protein
MRMIVDQPGDDGFAFEIDLFGAGIRELRNLRCFTHGDNATVLDRERLRNREPVVDGHDPAVDEDSVRRRENRWRRDEQQGQGHATKDAKDTKEERILDR